jgi:hypothetical protein
MPNPSNNFTLPPAGAPVQNGPGGAQVVDPASAFDDNAIGQWGKPGQQAVSITQRFQPTQEGSSIVTPGTFNTTQTINPLQQIATQVNNESVVGVLLAVAALVVILRIIRR